MESERRRERFPWQQIWISGDDRPYSEFEQSLTRFVRDKNDSLNCTMDHVDRCEDSLAVSRHKMRCIITKCVSQRCKAAGDRCKARYKILKCTEVEFVIVYKQGEHDSALDAPPSPRSSPELTASMKHYIESKLNDVPSMVAQLVYTFLCREISAGRISGQAPGLQKVQNFVKAWRSKNKPDSMEPVLEICRQRMYDGGALERTRDSLLVFCDTQDVDGGLVPSLGTGSKSSPFRIGLTCMALLENYVSVQRDPSLSTMMHLDSTHSIVKQKYPVFVVGISDRSGSFLPVVYFCTSLRKSRDIVWCLSFLKRVVLREFGVSFQPDLVMMDADKAQFKACQQELPGSLILMCWFHVMQNVQKHVKDEKLDAVTKQKLVRDLYDLHFAATKADYLRKREFVIRSWRGAGELSPRVKRVVNHLIKIWILGPRFTNWQAFHTPTGYASTNNPLETYHFTLKLVNNDKRANPTELISRLDLSRLGYVSAMQGFGNVTSVSKRLKAAFNRAEKQNLLEAEVVHRFPNDVRVRVWPKVTAPTLVDIDEEDTVLSIPISSDAQRSYGSVNYNRVIWEGMPTGGWVVDAIGRTCGCPGWRKAGICLHVIKATKVAQLPCPGMPSPLRRFVSPSGASRGRSTHTLPGLRAAVAAHHVGPLQAGDVVHGPATYRDHLSATYTVRTSASSDELSDASASTEVLEDSEYDNSEHGGVPETYLDRVAIGHSAEAHIDGDELDPSAEAHIDGDELDPSAMDCGTHQQLFTASQDAGGEARSIIAERELRNTTNTDADEEVSAPQPEIRRSRRRRHPTARAQAYAESKRRRREQTPS